MLTEAFDDLRDFIKVCASEAALLAALQEIAANRSETFSGGNAEAAEEMKNIARNAIARQKGTT